jgi:hypothetical protein
MLYELSAPVGNVRFRRVLLVAGRSGEGPQTEWDSRRSALAAEEGVRRKFADDEIEVSKALRPIPISA